MSATSIKGPLSEILELSKLKSPLIEIIKDLMEIWPVDTIEVTSTARTLEEDKKLHGSGIHVLFRAVDFRTITLPGGHATVYPITEKINTIWIYDPVRPHKVVAYAELHGSGFHLHLQVHDRTIRRDKIPQKISENG